MQLWNYVYDGDLSRIHGLNSNNEKGSNGEQTALALIMLRIEYAKKVIVIF